jgi:colicin import membrane protein
MHISKLLPAICVIAVFAGFGSLRAQDTPAQAAARAALMERMNELDAQQQNQSLPIVVTTNGATVVAPPVTVSEPTNPPAISEQANPPAVSEPEMKPVSNETQSDSEAQKQAVIAAENKAADEQAKADAQKTTQANQAATIADKKRAAAEAKAAAEQARKDKLAAEAKAKADAKAKAAADKAAKIQQQKQAEAEKERLAAEKAAEAVASANNTGKELGFKPIPQPPLPISAAKQEQLRALLAKYMADQISPAEYQSNRAEILAEP